jgi:hypothetical protein
VKITRLRAALSTAAALALVAAVASPAMAADAPRSLPAGDKLFAFAYNSGQPDGQMFSITGNPPVLDAVGTGSANGSQYIAQAAWDASTSTAYAIQWDDDTSLISIDPLSGEMTTPVQISEDNESAGLDSLAISPAGDAFGTYDQDFYSVDLSTGELTRLGDTATSEDTYGLAFDPNSGVLYGLDSLGNLYTIDPADGASTLIAELDLIPGSAPYSIQVDSAGILWIENDVYNENTSQDESELWTVDPSAEPIAGSAIRSGMLTLEGEFYTESLLLVPGTVEAPAFTSVDKTTVVAGTAVSFAVTAPGAVSFAIVGNLPAGLVFDSATGILSGKATVAGTYNFSITATNTGGTTTQAFTLTVSAAIKYPTVAG